MIENAANQTKYKLDKIISDCQENTELKLREIIFGSKNKDELITILENRISPVFNNSRSILDGNLITATNELNSSFSQVKEHFDQKFSQQYSKLKALSSKTNLDRIQSTKDNIQVSNSSVISIASEIGKAAGDKLTIAVGAGVGGGALLGTLIFPGVGTVVGALLGGIFGNLFSPSLSELQNRAWNELQPKIQDYFNLAKTGIEQSLVTYSQQMINQLNSYIDTYIATYQTIINTMQQDQQEEKQRLTRLQQDIKADLLEINTRVKSLEISKLNFNPNNANENLRR
jgi:gas vesicle protein